MERKKLCKDGDDYVDTGGVKYFEVDHVAWCRSCGKKLPPGFLQKGFQGSGYCMDCVEVVEGNTKKIKLTKTGDGKYVNASGFADSEYREWQGWLHCDYCKKEVSGGVYMSGELGSNLQCKSWRICWNCVEIVDEDKVDSHYHCSDCGVGPLAEEDRHVHGEAVRCHDCTADFAPSDAESDAAAMRLAVCLTERNMLKGQLGIAVEYLNEIRDRELVSKDMLQVIAQAGLTAIQELSHTAAEGDDNDTD